jgi:hypothetical protein
MKTFSRPKSAARRLGIEISTLYEGVASIALPAFRLPSRVRQFPPAEA